MWDNVIVYVHILGMLFFSIYAFVFRKSAFDYLYLATFYLVLLQWTFLNGECVLSIASKHVNNPDYVPGEDIHRDDIITLYPDHETSIRLAYVLKNAIFLLNYYLVCVRNHIPFYIYSLYLILYVMYSCSLFLFESHYENESFLRFQKVIQTIMLVGIVLFLLFLFQKSMR